MFYNDYIKRLIFKLMIRKLKMTPKTDKKISQFLSKKIEEYAAKWRKRGNTRHTVAVGFLCAKKTLEYDLNELNAGTMSLHSKRHFLLMALADIEQEKNK